jgi:1,2-dihydroxy-3-keto-5-methylthiopentene dioxygenase
MAKLKMEDGTILTDLAAIGREMAPLGITLHHLELSRDPAVTALLAKPVLTEDEKDAVLKAHDHHFKRLAHESGYQTRDLIVIHPDVPNLDAMLARFEKSHTHAEDEVRYIVDGDGVFGFTRPDGSQVELLVEPTEYVNVPVGTEHWFHLTGRRRIKAIRYFTNQTGWTPEYTGTPIRIAALG